MSFSALRLPRLGKSELILVLFVRLFDLRLFVFFFFVSSSSWFWKGLRFVIVALPGLFSYLVLVLSIATRMVDNSRRAVMSES